MAETLFIPTDTNRGEIYKVLFPQIEALIVDESDLTANLANITAVLKEAFGFFWVGILFGEGRTACAWPISGSDRVYADTVPQGRVRCELHPGRNDYRAGCRAVSWAYCMQLGIPFGDCGTCFPQKWNGSYGIGRG
jgi:hypothetical protein